ncbi:hypothetical protein ABEB36_004749 [Hypothenemus hampei]|uniref:CCHC-type domain-containing protein n=1 Tax=Hypothenemus hampei TaxID=57062 RepID=A0ABD1F4M1_HYPHA
MSVTLTDEQFQKLLSAVSINSVAGQSTQSNQGNFSNCPSRFDGSKSSDIKAFIDSVSIYKDCAMVSDKNAPMLLDGFAETWYQGVKHSINTWKQAVDLLLLTFGPHKPPHRVYRELFINEQENNIPTDVFVCKCRSILAQLPPFTLTEAVQLDMVYGLLHRRIRGKLTRDSVQTFSDLLTQARLIEESYELIKDKVYEKRSQKCQYCHNPGHNRDECRKLQFKQVNKDKISSGNKMSNVDNSSGRNISLNQSETIYSKTVHCYGCGNPGYIRSMCPKCSQVVPNKTNQNVSHEFFYNSLTTITNSSRPIVSIDILGRKGYAFLETGAKSSVAGTMLTEILVHEKIPCTEVRNMKMTLADGVQRVVRALIFNVTININSRSVQIPLLTVPEHKNSRTLLGVDFINAANILLNLPCNSYSFREIPDESHYLINENDVSNSNEKSIDSIEFIELYLREEEGRNLMGEQRQKLNELLRDNPIIFEPSDEPTPYAEHSIKLLDNNPIAVPPYRMSEGKKIQLRLEIDKLLENDMIEECESPYAALVVLYQRKMVEPDSL